MFDSDITCATTAARLFVDGSFVLPTYEQPLNKWNLGSPGAAL